MTLTTVVGSSGSGKTTFLNDVYKRHKCIYIRQYHNVRPYITVSKIPRFDPTKLPYWATYEAEHKADTIKVGGTLAGESTIGLSGGQRKILLFELVCQRIQSQSDLLIVLDEPFAGVTDDFVPYIVDRLDQIRKTHNILLVTNDHVDTLTRIADNTITVSAIDRSNVRINDQLKVDRAKAILAFCVGDNYVYDSSGADVKFFLEVEVWKNKALAGVAIFTIVVFLMLAVALWDSDESSAALVLVAAGVITFFCINPYLLSLVDWRVAIREEAEALVHSSKGMNKFLKTCLALLMIFVLSLVEYGFVNIVIDVLSDFKFWVAMLFDSASVTFPLIVLSIFTNLSLPTVHILGSLPTILMIFFSTTFSPGSGVPGLKGLRYVFARFYFWCMVPGVQDKMEGCPADDETLLYLILSSLLGAVIFIVIQFALRCKRGYETKITTSEVEHVMDDQGFQDLQYELFGDQALRRLEQTAHSPDSKTNDSNSEV